MRVLCLFLVACLALHARQQAVSAALTTAVLANPEGFAKAVGGLATDTVSVAQSVKSMIANTSADSSTIVNLSDSECTWYTYNEAALIKAWTNMQSHMGPNSIVQTKSLGWGSMSTFCNNQGPPFHLERNGLYTWDGQSLKLVVKKDQARRLMSRRRRMQVVSAALTTAVLANPEGFARAVGGLGKDTVSVAQSVKSMIANTSADASTIINLTDNSECTWYTYNEVAPIKVWTNMQSHMGKSAIVQVKSIGWGSMSTFCNNAGPPFHLERNGLYTWDGQSLKLVVAKDQARRMDQSKEALWRMHIRRLIEENPPRSMDEANTTAKIAEAVAADPEKWAKVAGDAAGSAVDIAGKIKSMIGASTSDSAMIINLSDAASCNWYTYNQAAPIKLTTTMQSFMGPSAIVRVKSLGFGSMSTYCNNESPPFQIDRGGVYTYDGTSLKLVVQDSRRRRRFL